MKHGFLARLAGGVFAWCAATATAFSTTVWRPTDSDINLLPILSPLSTASVDIALFDDTDTGFLDPLVVTLTPGSAEKVDVMDMGAGVWTFTHGADSITVSGGSFVFAVSTPGGWDTSMAGMNDLGANVWLLSLGAAGDTSFFAVDVQPIPVPPAVWLFGAGLLGLASVARRRTTD